MYTQKSPYLIQLKKDEETYICQCGKTKKPPYCDGNHKQTDGIKPLVYVAAKDETLTICGCGKSNNIPWCDGSHNK
jgi:CDGSH-type Zn-finger protein